jgi:hypothetical protein
MLLRMHLLTSFEYMSLYMILHLFLQHKSLPKKKNIFEGLSLKYGIPILWPALQVPREQLLASDVRHMHPRQPNC